MTKTSDKDLRVAREVIEQWQSDVDPDTPIFGEGVLLRDCIASALAAEREKAAKSGDVEAFRLKAIDAARRLQIGGLNRAVVYTMLRNL